MACIRCGAPTIAALTPAGRVVDLSFEHAWVRAGERWPTRLFILGAAGRSEPAVAHATPAIEIVDGVNYRNGRGDAGPFRRQHHCAGRRRLQPYGGAS